jgi:hypothetical protein
VHHPVTGNNDPVENMVLDFVFNGKLHEIPGNHDYLL